MAFAFSPEQCHALLAVRDVFVARRAEVVAAFLAAYAMMPAVVPPESLLTRRGAQLLHNNTIQLQDDEELAAAIRGALNVCLGIGHATPHYLTGCSVGGMEPGDPSSVWFVSDVHNTELVIMHRMD